MRAEADKQRPKTLMVRDSFEHRSCATKNEKTIHGFIFSPSFHHLVPNVDIIMRIAWQNWGVHKWASGSACVRQIDPREEGDQDSDSIKLFTYSPYFQAEHAWIQRLQQSCYKIDQHPGPYWPLSGTHMSQIWISLQSLQKQNWHWNHRWKKLLEFVTWP